MASFGGTGAEALKNGIDSIFDEGGQIPLSEDEYKYKVVACTSDGTNVNFGHKTGLMKRMAETREWLVKINCANHRVELAVKETIIGSVFTTADDTYIVIFNLLRSSGKIKDTIVAACKSENIQHYTLNKITGILLIIFSKLIL